MIDASVARRYARALFSLALEEGKHEQTGSELEALNAAIESNAEVRAIATDPAASTERQRSLVDALAKNGTLAPSTVSFLRLLADRGRLAELPAISRAFRTMLDEQVGRVRATVTSAVPLEGEQLDRLRQSLAQATQKSIVLEAKTDPSIVGGVIAQVGARQYDGSIKTQLERLRDELKQGAL